VTLGIDERIDELEQQLTDAMYAVEDAQDAVRDVEHALEALRDATKPRKAAAA
jgi:F0F1-type ATP synthase membrane subunit b/b'